MSYDLGTLAFSSKKAVKTFMSGILEPESVGQQITEPHHGVLADLILMHPRALEKLGSGVSHFEVFRTGFGNFGVKVFRVDGTSVDFSYYKCLDGESVRAVVSAAARRAVAEDIISYKTKHFSGVCEVTGEPVEFSEAHVDHAPPWPFHKILTKWLGAVGLAYNDIGTAEASDGIGQVLSNESQRASFRTFHATVMNLRVINARLNLSLGGHNE